VPENILGMINRDFGNITAKFRSPACHAFKVQECKLIHTDFKSLYLNFQTLCAKAIILMNQYRHKKHLLT